MEKEIIRIEQREINPQADAEAGVNAANVLKNLCTKANLIKSINNKDYMMFEGWQIVARFYNITVGVENVEPLIKDGEIYGFDARAYVKDRTGNVISNAEGYCGRDESKWRSRDNFAIKSMAQTRAQAKALRNVFAWVVTLAGINPTPAEEMQEQERYSTKTPEGSEIIYPLDIEVQMPKTKEIMNCSVCGKSTTYKEKEYSKTKFKTIMCFNCQKKRDTNVNKPENIR